MRGRERVCRRRWCRVISTLEDPCAMSPQNLDHEPRVAELPEVARRSVNSRDRHVERAETSARCANDKVRFELVSVPNRVDLAQHFGFDGAVTGLTVTNFPARDRARRR